MNNKDYQREAIKTANHDFRKIRNRLMGETGVALLFLLNQIQQRIKLMDEFKKYIYYGKQSDRVTDYSRSAYWFNEMIGTPSFEAKIEKARLLHSSPSFVNTLHGVIGIAGEFDELMDCFLEAPSFVAIDKTNLSEEMGDIFWFLNLICSETGTSFDSVMDQNISKLRFRFKDKFTESEAINRNHNHERKILES